MPCLHKFLFCLIIFYENVNNSWKRPCYFTYFHMKLVGGPGEMITITYVNCACSKQDRYIKIILK